MDKIWNGEGGGWRQEGDVFHLCLRYQRPETRKENKKRGEEEKRTRAGKRSGERKGGERRGEGKGRDRRHENIEPFSPS